MGGGGGGGALFQVSNLVFYAQSTIAVISGRVSFSMKSRKLLTRALFNAFAPYTHSGLVSLIGRDKVTRQCSQTAVLLKRKESRSGIEPRSFCLPA